jgi:hypothetical protein
MLETQNEHDIPPTFSWSFSAPPFEADAADALPLAAKAIMATCESALN